MLTADRPAGLTAVLFDLGGVLLSWAPERAYEQVLPPDEVPELLARIGFAEWNRTNDAGRPFDVGERELIKRFPDDAAAIRAYRQHFPHTLTGMVPGTGAVVAELALAGVRLVALTNWSAETFPHARRRFSILRRFEDIVVSGAEGLAKPDPAIFTLAVERHGLDPARTVFVDDAAANVSAAEGIGLTAVHFHDADQLRARLVELGLLTERRPVDRPIFHLTDRLAWEAAQATGEFPWSSANLSYDEQGFVHCSFADQVDGVLEHIYAGVPRDRLVLLELDPATIGVPVVVEDLDAGQAYPHLYGPLPVASVTAVHPVS